ncbi:TRAP transporter substrate-binding protein [uncultured Pseudokineococcus sp.]|uniref:TRAP transporter substrate-binding protein n=1 Tax=uncultured Pseudokineococcus sp. TaxID=1642928 RepID=UPI00260DF9AD|nr:TRAP transporter substrate-binding protein [uncultured Pseudokineococcus sp.]
MAPPTLVQPSPAPGRRRRAHACVVVAAASALVLASCGAQRQEAGAPELTLRLGHTYGVGSLQDRASQRLAENVAEASDGRVEIELYPAGQLGSWEDMQEGLEFGAVHMVVESVGSLERYTDLAAVEGVPFIYDSPEQFLAVWDGPLGEEIIEAIRDDTGFLLLGSMYRGGRVLNSDRPVERLEDLRGLKLRVPTQQTYLDTWTALGASPTPLALSEVFAAIEQGAVEGQENPVDVVRYNSFYEVAPYVAMTNHLYGNFHFQTWGEAHDSWPADLRAVIDDEVDEVSDWYRETSLAEQEENVEFLRAEGVTFTEVDREEWREATSEVLEEADPQVQEWVRRIQDGQA